MSNFMSDRPHPDLSDPHQDAISWHEEPTLKEDLAAPKVPTMPAAPTSGVQQAPSASLLDEANQEPTQLEEADFLKYQLLREKILGSQILLDMYRRELVRAQSDYARQNHELFALVRGLEKKYNTNLQVNQISDDGYIVPRPPVVTDEAFAKLMNRRGS